MIRYALLITNFQLKKKQNLKQLLSPADLTDVQNKPIQFLDIDTAKNTLTSLTLAGLATKHLFFFFSPFKSVQCLSPLTFMCPINAMQRL